MPLIISVFGDNLVIYKETAKRNEWRRLAKTFVLQWNRGGCR